MTASNKPMISVLVIDDEEIIRSLTTEIFSFLGHKCVTAEDGTLGIEQMRKHNFDLVLLDYYMPDMLGEEVLGLLMKEFPQAKVLITTGKELDDDEKERISALGAKGVLRKPFTIAELSHTIEELCH